MQRHSCDANASVAYVVASVHAPGTAKHELVRSRFANSSVPDALILPAVNGFNETEVIEVLLGSGLQFHNLSKFVRKWGKLATFLTKHRMLRHQVEHSIPFQVTFEDDVVALPPFRHHVQAACSTHYDGPHPDLVKMSGYAEIFMTSLAGARRVLRALHKTGIVKNDDQQLGSSELMGYTVKDRKETPGHRGAWKLARKTNAGEITATRGMTWHEMAMLRLLTNPAARHLPAYGMPVPLPELACRYGHNECDRRGQ
jgi:hypothetical protein